ncbi:MAG: efflux RND transporter periplasmic adaptor subunit [Bacteroidales bacterium]
MKKRLWIIIIIALAIMGVALILFVPKLTSNSTYAVKTKPFLVTKTLPGEIRSIQSKFINIPEGILSHEYRIREIKITDLIDEGTIVKKGDYIGMLDPSNLQENMRNNSDKLDAELANLAKAKVDSSLTLSNSRQSLKELNYDIQYAKLDKEQSIYESPAYQRKMEVAYETALRDYSTEERNYKKEVLRQRTNCRRIEDGVEIYQKRDKFYKNAIQKVRITSPADGMLIYVRTSSGSKVKVGDDIYMWDPRIATLPDVSNLISEVYLEEVYVSQISVGDSVNITISALENRKIKGSISSIANVGQQLTGSSTKVFKVGISVKQTAHSTDIKPYMTTQNEFILYSQNLATTVPIGGLFFEEGVNFVYLKDGGSIKKQKVLAGTSNDTDIHIVQGLQQGDVILLYEPEDHAKIPFNQN